MDDIFIKLNSNDKMRQEFAEAKPFPHIIIDDFVNVDYLEEALAAFPEPNTTKMYSYDNPLERKWAFDQLSKLPEDISIILKELNSTRMLSFLESVTGIKNLVPDPDYRGGGIHIVTDNGKLDIHVDFNIHPKLKLQRRLNALIFLNKDWKEEYGGYLELWEGFQENGNHKLSKCIKKIAPTYNRLVIFETSEKSYHGFPDPIHCPDTISRKSLATYYYTKETDGNEAHSTTYVSRPQDPEDAELDALREKRNQGRLSSNIDLETD